jgi:AraC-like DNA-binding protein
LENLCQTAKASLLVPHRTDFYHVFLFENCSPTHSIDFEPIEIQANSLLFLGKDRVHQFDKNLAYRGKLLIFTEDFYCINPSDSKFLQSTILFNDLFDNFQFATENLSLFLQICQTIESEIKQPDDEVKREILKNDVHNFLLLAEREKRKKGFLEIKKSAELDDVLLFKDLLEAHFSQIKTVSVYAEKLCIAEKKLNQSTTKILGKTPKQLIDARVLLEAKRLLIHDSKSIKEIAYELGFDEPTNFIKYFKKHTQKTPTEFRR